MADEEKCFRYRILTKQPAKAEDLSLPEQLRTEVSTAVRAVACQQHFLRPGTISGGSIGDGVRQTVNTAFNLDPEAMAKPLMTKLQTTLHNLLAEPNTSSFSIPVSAAQNYKGFDQSLRRPLAGSDLHADGAQGGVRRLEEIESGNRRLERITLNAGYV